LDDEETIQTCIGGMSFRLSENEGMFVEGGSSLNVLRLPSIDKRLFLHSIDCLGRG